MAQQGHAPTNGPGNQLYLLGQGLCPGCRTGLEPAPGDRYRCNRCERTFPIAGDVE